MSKYSLKRQATNISLEKEEGGSEEFVLREMTAANRDGYLDRLAKRIKVGPNGESQGVAKFEGLQADLISSCLYRDGKPVPSEEIQGWPASVVGGIFKQAQELNRLDKEHEESALKNE